MSTSEERVKAVADAPDIQEIITQCRAAIKQCAYVIYPLTKGEPADSAASAAYSAAYRAASAAYSAASDLETDYFEYERAAIAAADATRPKLEVTPMEAHVACERLESLRQLGENDYEEQDMKAVLEDFLSDREAALEELNKTE